MYILEDTNRFSRWSLDKCVFVGAREMYALKV